jgi:hypothetical protein
MVALANMEHRQNIGVSPMDNSDGPIISECLRRLAIQRNDSEVNTNAIDYTLSIDKKDPEYTNILTQVANEKAHFILSDRRYALHDIIFIFGETRGDTEISIGMMPKEMSNGVSTTNLGRGSTLRLNMRSRYNPILLGSGEFLQPHQLAVAFATDERDHDPMWTAANLLGAIIELSVANEPLNDTVWFTYSQCLHNEPDAGHTVMSRCKHNKFSSMCYKERITTDMMFNHLLLDQNSQFRSSNYIGSNGQSIMLNIQPSEIYNNNLPLEHDLCLEHLMFDAFMANNNDNFTDDNLYTITDVLSCLNSLMTDTRIAQNDVRTEPQDDTLTSDSLLDDNI